MRDAKQDIEFIDSVLEKIKNGEADIGYGMLMMHRDSIASDAGLCCCEGCGEWVPMSDLSEIDMCAPCMECLAECEETARDDALSQAADDRIEAEKINRHLWSLGGRVPLILIAAWSVVAACGGVPWQ